MRIEFHPETVSELNNAAGYYLAIRPELADSFRREIYETIERIKFERISEGVLCIGFLFRSYIASSKKT